VHESSIKNIVLWYAVHFEELSLNKSRLVEIGSYDINGSIKSILPEEILGVDICEGPCVDLVIAPGDCPRSLEGAFGAAISANAFHLCGDPGKYKQEVVKFLKSGGLFVLTMCRPDCSQSHNTSPNKYGYRDGIRMQPEELRAFWEPQFECEKVFIQGHDLVYWGRKK